MKLRHKILAGYVLPLLLLGVLVGWAIWNLNALGRASAAILRENYRSILAAGNMIGSLERQESIVLQALQGIERDPEPELVLQREEFLQWLTRARDNITVAGEAELVDRIERGYRDYQLRLLELSGLLRSDPLSAARFFRERLAPVFGQVRQSALELRQLNEATMLAASRRAEQVALRAVISTLVVGLAALLLGLVFSLMLSGRLVRPLQRIVQATQALARGDYSTRVPVEGRDEVGLLAAEFNLMAERLEHYNSLNLERIIAEKSKSEAVLAGIRDGIIVLDNELRITDINPAAEGVFSADRETLLGRPIRVLVDEERFNQALSTGAGAETAPRKGEEPGVVAVGEDDKLRYFSYTLNPIEGGSGDNAGMVVLLRDVTRMKELDRMKSEFVMAASHELKTPLTSIGMSVDLLLERTRGQLGDKEQLLLSTAREETQRLKGLVNELLDLSRIESGKIELEFHNCRIGELFRKVAAVFEPQARPRGIRLEVSLDDGLPEVYADAGKVSWVLTNLLSNALRYVGEGGRIELSAEQAGGQVQLSVYDDGPGIPIEYQSRIFDKFVQVRGQDSPGGSGLGLAICREIVRAHKGTIWVDSMPGKGSTFSFTLPVGA